jgi:hypothetical protein
VNCGFAPSRSGSVPLAACLGLAAITEVGTSWTTKWLPCSPSSGSTPGVVSARDVLTIPRHQTTVTSVLQHMRRTASFPYL